MTYTFDPLSHWTRQLAGLRARAVKRSRVAPCGDLTEDALSMCDSLLRELAGARRESDRLREDIRTSEAAWEHLFELMPGARLLTDPSGFILNANRAAGVLLNLSAKRLKNRELGLFYEDRQAFRALVQRLSSSGGDELRATLTLRARERKPAAMHVAVKPLPSRDRFWLWFLTPASQGQTAPPFHLASDGESLTAAS